MRADRLLRLLLFLQTRGKTKARELALELGVSTRTVYRDVEALSLAGVPVYCEPGPAGGVLLTESYRTRLTGLSEREALALAAFSVPNSLEGLGLSDSLRTALLKLVAAVPGLGTDRVSAVRQRLHIDTSPWAEATAPPVWLTELQRAIWEDRRIRFRYQRGDGTGSRREAAPWGLVLKIDRWYLAAGTDRGARVFRLDRMDEVTVLEDTFERPEGFELEAFWQRWQGEFLASLPSYPVTLRLGARAAEVLEQDWGPGEELAPADETGRRLLRHDLQRLDIAWRSLLSLDPATAAELEVTAPAELRRRFLELGRRLTERYRDASRVDSDGAAGTSRGE